MCPTLNISGCRSPFVTNLSRMALQATLIIIKQINKNKKQKWLNIFVPSHRCWTWIPPPPKCCIELWNRCAENGWGSPCDRFGYPPTPRCKSAGSAPEPRQWRLKGRTNWAFWWKITKSNFNQIKTHLFNLLFYYFSKIKRIKFVCMSWIISLHSWDIFLFLFIWLWPIICISDQIAFSHWGWCNGWSAGVFCAACSSDCSVILGTSSKLKFWSKI